MKKDKVYTILTGIKRVELTEEEILSILKYYYSGIFDNSSSIKIQMTLFYKLYDEDSSKRRTFKLVAKSLFMEWKSVEKTYYKYRHEYE